MKALPSIATQGENTPSLSASLENREGQILVAKHLAPVMCAIFEKIGGAFDGQSRLDLPNGKALVYSGHNEEYAEYRCGANYKISLPMDFIDSLHEGSPEQIDQLIRDWSVALNGLEIPPELWCDNPHYDIEKPLVSVPKQTQEILDDEPISRGTRGQRLMRKLLPQRIPENHTDDTSPRGVQKLRQTEYVKFPILRIKKRESI